MSRDTFHTWLSEGFTCHVVLEWISKNISKVIARALIPPNCLYIKREKSLPLFSSISQNASPFCHRVACTYFDGRRVPPRAKTQAAVCIVTCTSGPGGCQVVCKGESFGDYEDKKFVLSLPQQEGEPLCQRSLKCTLNISSPIAGRDTTFSNGPNVCGDGFSQTTKQIFITHLQRYPAKAHSFGFICPHLEIFIFEMFASNPVQRR